MSSQFYKDDNAEPLVDPGGLRPVFGASNFLNITMSGSIQTGALPASFTGAQTLNGQFIVRIATGAQAAYVAFGGSGLTFTGVTDMFFIPINSSLTLKLNGSDTNYYVLQGGSAGNVQIAPMS
jgi:hypothetical protein